MIADRLLLILRNIAGEFARLDASIKFLYGRGSPPTIWNTGIDFANLPPAAVKMFSLPCDIRCIHAAAIRINTMQQVLLAC